MSILKEFTNVSGGEKQKYMRFQERRYPPEVLPEGLSLERQTYLYKEIRGFIRDPKNLDLTCPVPSASQ
jgi:hypothetical protein